ncbi:MAG: hypothetical protein KatS3mg002_0310 [Candidatus Woesearchaeota archaeon]|nr:MAG: hypothetical protein KatS3mg002_0310 [Candidatus Woesearchaeota archaeon]
MGHFKFDPYKKIIGIPEYMTTIDLRDLYTEVIEWSENEGISFDVPMNAVGNFTLGEGIATDIVYILKNGWKLKYLGIPGSIVYNKGGLGINLGNNPSFSWTSLNWSVNGNGEIKTDSKEFLNQFDIKRPYLIFENSAANNIVTYEADFPIGFDTTGTTNIVFWILTDYPENLKSFKFYLWEDANKTKGVYVELTESFDMPFTWAKHSLILEIGANKASFTSINGGTLPSIFTKTEIVCETTSNGPVEVYVSDPYINYFSEPIIIIGSTISQDVYNLKTILDSYSLPGTLCLDIDYLNINNYLTSSQVTDLIKNQWSIVPIYPFRADLITQSFHAILELASLSYNTIYNLIPYEIQRTSNLLLDLKTILFSPSYDVTHTLFNTLNGILVNSVFDRTFIKKDGLNYHPNNLFIYHHMYKDDEHDLDYMLDEIDIAIKTGGHLFLLFDGISDSDPTKFTTTEFDQFISYALSKNVKILTLREYLQRITITKINVIGTLITDDNSSATVPPDYGNVEFSYIVGTNATVIDHNYIKDNIINIDNRTKYIPIIL